jgi:hypothetical protein
LDKRQDIQTDIRAAEKKTTALTIDMSLSQVLSGTPAGLTSIGTINASAINVNTIASDSGVPLSITSSEGLFLNHGPATGGYGVQINNVDNSGTTHLSIGSEGYSFVQWVNLDAPGPTSVRNTYEDWGYYTPGALSRRYTQYAQVEDCSGGDGGTVLLNWGMLDPARIGQLVAGAGPVVTGISSITAADIVLFTPALIPAGGCAAPVVSSTQAGVGFTLAGAIPVGEAWNYTVIRGGGPTL